MTSYFGGSAPILGRKRIMLLQPNLRGSKISTSSTTVVFFGPIGKKDGRLGLCLAETFLTLPLKPLNGIQRNLTGSKISTSSTKFVLFRLIWKEDGRPGLWFAETFSTSLLKLLKRIQRNLTGSRISTSSTKFVFLCRSKKKMSALASDWLRHF